MESRPKLKIKNTPTDNLVEAIGWFTLIALWFVTLTSYANLPQTIPTHYNAAGVADGYGSKTSIFGLPIIATLLFVVLTILNKFPHAFNYLTPITNQNALEQYTNATKLIRYLKLGVVFIFFIIDYKTIQHATGETIGLGSWFLPVSLAIVFIPLLYFILKSIKTPKK